MECSENIDPVSLNSLENLSEEEIVRIPKYIHGQRQGNWCFEVSTIAELIKRKNFKNPVTREPWTNEQLDIIYQKLPPMPTEFEITKNAGSLTTLYHIVFGALEYRTEKLRNVPHGIYNFFGRQTTDTVHILRFDLYHSNGYSLEIMLHMQKNKNTLRFTRIQNNTGTEIMDGNFSVSVDYKVYVSFFNQLLQNFKPLRFHNGLQAGIRRI